MAGAANRMRAARFAAPERVDVVDAPVPEPGPGEVRVRIEGTGVCGSNLAAWQGTPWMEYPLEPGAGGHEAWGRVDALGPGVDGVRVGDRVAALFQHAFAEYDVAPADTVVPVPDALEGAPVPAEALACAVNAFQRSDVRAGQTVAVVGVGFLGAVLVRLAVAEGARVIAITRRESALDVASEYGAAERLRLDDADKVVESVDALTDGELCDRVIECTGREGPLDLAARLTRTRGRLVIVGYHQDGPRQVNMQLWNWRGLDVVNAHERDPAHYVRGMREALDAVVTGRLDPGPLYTHSFPLRDVARAFHALASRPPGFMKALVRCTDGE